MVDGLLRMSGGSIFRDFILKLRASPLYQLVGNDSPETKRKKLDLFLAATALKSYAWKVDQKDDKNARVNEKIVAQFVEDLEGMYDKGRENYVHNEINRQMIGLFQQHHKTEQLLSHVATASGKGQGKSGKPNPKSAWGDDGSFGMGDSSDGLGFIDNMLESKAEDQTHKCLLDFSLEVCVSVLYSVGARRWS